MRRKNPKYSGGMTDQLFAASERLAKSTVQKAKALANRFSKKYPQEFDRYYVFHDIADLIARHLSEVK